VRLSRVEEKKTPVKTLKWINRFAPMYAQAGVGKKRQDLPLGTVVEATGVVDGSYEEIVYSTPIGTVTGWAHTDDLEDYIRNFQVNSVVIENQTPDIHDFEQYIIYKLQKQVNMCGELSVCHVLGVSLGTLLKDWELKVPAFFKRVFGLGRARGTDAEELGEMFAIFGRTSQTLTQALFQPHIKRARYTIKGLNNLLAKGGVIVSVHIDATTGLLRGSGVLHWVSLVRIIPERNGQGMVQFYNPAMNCVETCSWSEFLGSAGQPYGMFSAIMYPPLSRLGLCRHYSDPEKLVLTYCNLHNA
jgi:hypothetical protein